MKGCPECGQRFLGNEEFCPKDGATLAEMDATTEDPLVGTTLDGRYTIDKKLGEGGMGVVYLATHAIIGKKCAVKVLRGELSGETEVAERFTQEARAAAAIGNEHIIEITDFGQLPDGAAYFVMEFLDGQALQDLLEEEEKAADDRVLHIIVQCCDALSAAHNIDVVHRDLKPDNIFLITKSGDSDFVKILDFGIAKVARESGRLTRTGVIFGTPQYMSPEQAAGTNIDARTDVYSLGIIMYEMLTGHVPFEADTFMGVLTKHLYEEPIPPRRLVPPVDISQSTESVVLKAIAKKPEKRYQSMAEFRQDVQALLEGKTPATVGEQMRSTSMSTLPPPSPAEIVGGKKAVSDDLDITGKKSRWPLLAGLGAAVVVAGIVVSVLFLGGSNEKKAEARPANVPPATAALSKPAVATPAAAEPPPAKEAEKKLVKVESTPKGARLYKNGALIGSLPVDLPRPGDDESGSKYQIKLDGYEDLDIIISSITPKVFSVALEKASPAAEPKKEKTASSRSSRKKKRSSSRDEKEKKSAIKVIKVENKKKKKKRIVGSDLADPWAQ